MYIDSLTVAAQVLLIAAISAFVLFCVLKHCGLTAAGKGDGTTVATRGILK